MKNSFSSLLILIAGAFLFSACEKCGNPTVSEISLDEYSWMMQNRGDRLIFKNESGERVRYDVINKVAQTVYPSGTSMDDDCIDRLDTQAIMFMQDTTGTLPQLAVFLYKSPADLEVWLAVEDRGDWEIDETTTLYPTKEINGISYSNVYELTPDTEEDDGVKQVLFNKQHGFLYIEYNDGTFIIRES